MSKMRWLGSLAVIAALTGCASAVTVPDAHRETKPAVRALEGFTVELSPQAKGRLPANTKFDVGALNKAMDRAFAERGLVAPDGDYRLKVVVTEIRVRSTFNAIMWGFMAGDDHVNGDGIISRKGDESQVHQFQIKTSYALGGFAGGQDSARMDWMYQEFAKQVANYLVEKRDTKG